MNTLAQLEIDARGNREENLKAYVVVDTLADKLAEVMVLTLNDRLAQKRAQACPQTRRRASRCKELDN